MACGRRRDGTRPGCTRSLNSLQPDILIPLASAVQGKGNIRPPVSTLTMADYVFQKRPQQHFQAPVLFQNLAAPHQEAESIRSP